MAMRTIDYIVANPAGNITILVLSPTDRSEYQATAKALLDHCPEAEQVGYILSDQGTDVPGRRNQESYPAMEMCGLEFCGNASRAFAYYEARQADPPVDEITVSVSGSKSPLHAWVDAEGHSSRIEMPVPTEIENITVSLTSDFADLVSADAPQGNVPQADAPQSDVPQGKAPQGVKCPQLEGRLVHMEGISHLVITAISAAKIRQADRDTMDELFMQVRDSVYQTTDRDLPAFGVMFYDTDTSELTPIVYVRDVDTTYFEGSCASGSTATAFALAMGDDGAPAGGTSGAPAGGTSGAPAGGTSGAPATGGVETHKPDGVYSYELRQPAGTLFVDVQIAGGKAQSILLNGSMDFTPVRQLVIED